MRSCRGRPQKFIICASLHKIEDYQYGVAGCQKAKEKICVHITFKCTHYMRAYAANFLCCTLRYKAEINIRKEKNAKKF